MKQITEQNVGFTTHSVADILWINSSSLIFYINSVPIYYETMRSYLHIYIFCKFSSEVYNLKTIAVNQQQKDVFAFFYFAFLEQSGEKTWNQINVK